jgi:hypothetical protein
MRHNSGFLCVAENCTNVEKASTSFKRKNKFSVERLDSEISIKRDVLQMEEIWYQKVNFNRADTVYWRCRYLQSLKRFRECREIFYLDETWVDSSLTFKKCWQRN